MRRHDVEWTYVHGDARNVGTDEESGAVDAGNVWSSCLLRFQVAFYPKKYPHYVSSPLVAINL